MGTLLRLDRPIERLRGSLSARGILISEEQAVAALTAEVREYRAEHLRGVDNASVSELRHRCADVFREQLPSSLDHDRAHSVLMSLLRFQVLPGSKEALAQLRDAGMGLAVVSNWDVSLEGAMLAVGLRGSFDVVVSSASVGAAKPDPAPLARALELLGAEAEHALMIGDHAVDAEAAAALGMNCAQVQPGTGITEAVAAILALPA